MADNSTFRVNSAGAHAWIDALLINASLVKATFTVCDTFRATIWRLSHVTGQT